MSGQGNRVIEILPTKMRDQSGKLRNCTIYIIADCFRNNRATQRGHFGTRQCNIGNIGTGMNFFDGTEGSRNSESPT